MVIDGGSWLGEALDKTKQASDVISSEVFWKALREKLEDDHFVSECDKN